MGLKTIFKKCKNCKRSGLFEYIDDDGYCSDCARKIAQRKAIERNRIHEKESDPLDNFHRGLIYAKPIYMDCPIVYKYRNVSVENVDRDILRRIASTEDYQVDVAISDDDHVILKSNNDVVATLLEKSDMCKDWINRNDPVICEFVAFKSGAEKVALYFYKDEQSKFSACNSEVIKLTSFMSSSKQETISCLSSGEKLFVEFDDNGKQYLKDIDNYPVGNLPAKYAKLYDNGEICGIYFDHSDSVENDNGDQREIPFVKVYF